MIQYRSNFGLKVLFVLLAPVLAGVLAGGIWMLLPYLTSVRPGDKTRFIPLIEKCAKEFRLDPNLISAVVWQESRFNPNVIGKKGDIGLMQLMPGASVTDWADMTGILPPSPGALTDPELNLRVGTWYLSSQLQRFKRIPAALAAYNAGPSAAKRWFGEKPQGNDTELIAAIGFPSTRSYVSSILAEYERHLANAYSRKVHHP